MRLLDRWRGARMSDDLDPELSALFARSSSDQAEPPHLGRTRALVAARLDAPAPTNGLARRLGLAGIGGGSMWVGLVGAAAAHKAVAITTGLTLVLGGGVAAEATGVGPAVRDTVASVVQPEPEEQVLALEGNGQNESEDEQVAEANLGAESTATGHEACSAATEHARGVLESLRDGSFFDGKDLPEQANPGPRSDTALTRALEALENCGTGTDEGVEGASDEEEAPKGEAERGRPDGVPNGPPSEPRGQSMGEAQAEVEDDSENDDQPGQGERPEGVGQPAPTGRS